MFPLHLRFVETCNIKFWRFYQVFVMFRERKCQVMFKSGRFRCCSLPLCFWKRIFNICILVESLQRKPTDDGFMHLTILTRKLDLTMNAVFPVAGQGFKITKWSGVWYFSQILRNRRNPSNPNYHMSINNRQAIQTIICRLTRLCHEKQKGFAITVYVFRSL